MQIPLDILEKAVRFCENQGAEEAEAFGVLLRELVVTLERNDIGLCIMQHITGMGIRTMVRKSVGFACCNSLEGEIVEDTAQRAIKMARKIPPLPCSAFAQPRPLSTIEGLYDPAVEGFDEQTAISTARRAILVTREDPRTSVDKGEFTIMIREKMISTSSGISAAEKKSRFSWFLMGKAKEGATVSSFAYQYGCTVKAKELYPLVTAQKMAAEAVAQLHPKNIEPFLGDVILGPQAVSYLIGNAIVFSANAHSVYKRQSPLLGNLGEKIASSSMTIRDNPTLPGDFNSSGFDREGTAHQNVLIVEKGLLRSFLYDSLAANRESRESTGNAVGTFRELPRIGISNLMVEKGSHRLETMIEETDKGLLVNKLSGTFDQISGDFSGALRGAQLVESGEIHHPVKQATISGNVFEILKRVDEVSSETARYPKMIMPYMRIPEMQIIA